MKVLVEEICLGLTVAELHVSLALRSGIPELSFRECLMNDQNNFLLHFPCDAWVSCDVAMSSTYAQYDDLIPFCT